DPVVSKCTEIEVRKGIIEVSWRKTCRAAQPDRRVSGRDEQAAIERALNDRHEASIDLIALRFNRPLPALLVVDMPERTAKIPIGELHVSGEQAVHVDRNVLILGKTIEVERRADADVEIKTARQIEYEGLFLPDFKDRSFSTRLGRTEQIVEVPGIQLGEGVPIVALIVRFEVNALRLRQIA